MILNSLKTPRKNASKLLAFLKEKHLLEKKASVFSPKAGKFVFFPVKKLSKADEKFVKQNFGAISAKKNFKIRQGRARSLKELLSRKLSKREMKLLVTSFDTLGNIAIIEIPKELEKKEKIIAHALLELNKNIKTVCKKIAAHGGKFRVEPVKIIAGKKNLVAAYRESGCVFRISLGKVFFSPRLSTERLRIAKQIKKGEIVGALFAGVGPFPIVFAKNSPMEKAFAVELNPKAFEDLKENVKRNNAGQKVEAILGDVRKIVPEKLVGQCSRVVMPLPKGGETFLSEAIECIKPQGGIVHFYDFVPADNPFEGTIKKIRAAAALQGRRVKILSKKKVRDFSATIIQVVVDFRVN